MPVPATDGVLRFVHPQAFLLLWLLLPLAAAIVVAGRARRRDARRFRSAGEPEASTPSARPLLAVLTLLGLAALVIAVARPGWEAQAATVERRGRDVVFVVDVSRSMLAEDLAPNRLERVKLAILDTAEVLSGDRVALVAFAGSAVVKSPLTFDYGFFRMAVQQLSVTSVSRGGSLIGDALRTVRDDVLDSRMREFKDVLLFTDGGDHDSFPVQAAEELGLSGVRVVAIGVGDDATGQPIPDPAHAGAAAPVFIEQDGQNGAEQARRRPVARGCRCDSRRSLRTLGDRQRRPRPPVSGADRRGAGQVDGVGAAATDRRAVSVVPGGRPGSVRRRRGGTGASDPGGGAHSPGRACRAAQGGKRTAGRKHGPPQRRRRLAGRPPAARTPGDR